MGCRLLQLNAQAPGALAESRFATFKDFANQPPDRRVLEAAALIGDFRQAAWAVGAAGRDDDLVSVGVDDEISRCE